MYFLLYQQHHSHAMLYSCERASTDTEEKKLLNKVIILVFFAHKKFLYSFIKLQLNNWCHMDYFKGLLHPKMKIWSLITYPHVVPNP